MKGAAAPEALRPGLPGHPAQTPFAARAAASLSSPPSFSVCLRRTSETRREPDSKRRSPSGARVRPGAVFFSLRRLGGVALMQLAI